MWPPVVGVGDTVQIQAETPCNLEKRPSVTNSIGTNVIVLVYSSTDEYGNNWYTNNFITPTNAGTFTVTAWDDAPCTDSFPPDYLTVIDVGCIYALPTNSYYTNVPCPTYVVAYVPGNYTPVIAVPNPDIPDYALPSDWAMTGGAVTASPTERNVDDGTTGPVTVSATVGSSTLSAEVVVVGVLKVQYLDSQSNWDDIGDFVIPTGTTVNFKALPNPAGWPFAEDTPIWRISSLDGDEDFGVGEAELPKVFDISSLSDTDIVSLMCGTTALSDTQVIYPNFLVCNTIVSVWSRTVDEGLLGRWGLAGHAYIKVNNVDSSGLAISPQAPVLMEHGQKVIQTGLTPNNSSFGCHKLRIAMCIVTLITTMERLMVVIICTRHRKRRSCTPTFTWMGLLGGWTNNCVTFATGIPFCDVNAVNSYGLDSPRVMQKSIEDLESADPTDGNVDGPYYPKFDIPLHGGSHP